MLTGIMGRLHAQGDLPKRGQSAFLELAGPGVVYSVNYDSRWRKSGNGIGGRVGVSYFQGADVRIFTLPLMINYLLGSSGNYLDVGAGATFVASSYQSSGCSCVYPEFLILQDYGNSVMPTFNLGYRREPADGGLTFRIGVSPVLTKHRFVPWWPYLGVGYAF